MINIFSPIKFILNSLSFYVSLIHLTKYPTKRFERLLRDNSNRPYISDYGYKNNSKAKDIGETDGILKQASKLS